MKKKKLKIECFKANITSKGVILPPYIVCKAFMFVSLFVRTDLVTIISHERLEQSQWILQGIFTSRY